MRRIPLLIFAAILMAGASRAEDIYRPMLLQVTPIDKTQHEFLIRGHFDIAHVASGVFDIVADSEDYQRLQKAGLNPVVVHEDLVAFYQSRNPLGTDMGGFRTLDEAIGFMDSLHGAFPAITTDRQSIGQSIEGRDMWMMKISDNPYQDEDEPEFFINGLTHAREPMGLEANLRFMAYLCENYGVDSLVTELVNNREFYFVPLINPDGYEYNRQHDPNGGGMWRKNRRNNGGSYGVDLNRNWGYMWGYDNEGSSPNPYDETYRGTGPFSEPETQALREFIDSRHFSIIMNFHTYGDYMLYPWGYYEGHTEDNQLLSSISETACAQNGYAYGTPWEVLYPTNGESCDWQYGEQSEKPKILGFVIEIGTSYDGFWPQRSRIDPLWNEVLPPLLYLSQIADNPLAQAPPAAPILNPIGDVHEDSFVVSWEFTDTVNTAVAYELKEFAGLQTIEEDFEDGTSNWNLDGFYTRTTRHHSGTHSMFSGTENNYNGSAILANPITVGDNDTLSIWAWYNIENNFDYAYVQLSTDGGVTFANLAGNITTNYNPYGTNRGNGITGSSGGWVQGKFPLDDYAGQTVLTGMRYITDQGVQYEGFYADQYYPVETFEMENVLSSDIPDTFYVVSGRQPGEYYYQVRAIDEEEQWSVFSNREMATVYPTTGTEDRTLPVSFALEQNYPNPFNPQTSIGFTLARQGRANLTVYSLLGMKVRTLVDGELIAGKHSFIFDGRDDSGNELGQGVYFYRLSTDSGRLTRKMVLLK